ncbi:MAG: nucleoside deaminase [Oscillatoriales cyanobacterium SM2_2_1]|nr:nucleoside deaminase [Oscillatoriales cyanobacterium SM2_2_1]
MEHEPFIQAAIAEARQGLTEGGIPIGSVLVKQGQIVGRGHNRRVQQNSTILHGEMDALERTGRQPAAFYRDVILYTTLSPCPMCSGTILLYKIPHVVVGEHRTFLGEEDLLRSRGVRVDVLDHPECTQIMERFIQAQPNLWFEDIGELV